MPTIIDLDTQREQEVSEAVLGGLHAEVQSGTRDRVSVRTEDGPQRQRLWDAVEGAWTSLIPLTTLQLMLREVVFKCSACLYTTTWEGQVAKHVAQAREQGVQHRRARLTVVSIGREMGKQCGGCGHPFIQRKQAGEKHLANIRTSAEAHRGEVQEVVMHRYAFREGLAQVLGTRPAAAAELRGGRGAA